MKYVAHPETRIKQFVTPAYLSLLQNLEIIITYKELDYGFTRVTHPAFINSKGFYPILMKL